MLSPAKFYQHPVINYFIDLSKNKRTLHLVCCFFDAVEESSEELSIVQKLASALHAKILSYGDYEQVHYYGDHQELDEMINDMGDISICKLNKVKRFM